MSDSGVPAAPLSGRTAWARNLEAPLGAFLRTETGSAAVLLSATVVALLWANLSPTSYQDVWHADLSLRLSHWGITQNLRGWVNSGLMTFFFFVVGLEARREFDMGELRERRRLTLPLVAGVSGMIVPVAIYLALNVGRESAHGWGAAMSTDTAFALGMLALLGPAFPERTRAFLLTVSVVDDVVALLVIAVAYSERITVMALIIALALFGAVLLARAAGVRYGLVPLLLGVAAWLALFESGVDPVVIGLAMGLITYAYPAARIDLEHASEAFRSFREQPTPELARTASIGLWTAISPNDRLQQSFHAWSSYAIVPLFALANAGITIDAGFLSSAYTSPITMGIVLGYLLGKPVGIVGGSWLVTRISHRALRPPVGWATVAGGGTIAGIGFTVSLLIATLAFSGEQLQYAKVGVLTAALLSCSVTWVVFRATAMLPPRLRARAVLGTSENIIDLAIPVDVDRDHVRGPFEAPVTVVEYGDFECPYCGQAEPVVRELLAGHGDVRYVWRHLPLNDVHPRAQVAAEAAEAAAQQGAFWAMHDQLFRHQEELRPMDLLRYARELELDVERFGNDLRKHTGAARIATDVDSADLSGVSGTPTFFINGRRHHGAYDIGALTSAVHQAKTRAAIGS
jgi:Na+/H+ antiporter NhaA